MFQLLAAHTRPTKHWKDEVELQQNRHEEGCLRAPGATPRAADGGTPRLGFPNTANWLILFLVVNNNGNNGNNGKGSRRCEALTAANPRDAARLDYHGSGHLWFGVARDIPFTQAPRQPSSGTSFSSKRGGLTKTLCLQPRPAGQQLSIRPIPAGRRPLPLYALHTSNCATTSRRHQRREDMGGSLRP